MMKAPNPAGSAPDDFGDVEWMAYQAIAIGTSQRQAAAAIGRSSGTVSGWVRKWRKRYGADLFKGQAQANTDASNQQIAGEGGRTPDSAVAASWDEARAENANSYGKVAAAAAEALEKFLTDLIADPKRMADMSVADARWLEKIGSGSVATADRLADLAHPDRKAKTGRVIGAAQVNVDLGGLTTRSQSDNVIELRDRVFALKDSFERRRNAVPADSEEATG